MKALTSRELRTSYLNFFADRQHAVIGSASLIPENDPTVLFTTAGMHPLVPYLLGQKHPSGNRLTDVQKCVRTGDIDEVGDDTHLTFFEMLGNWSLGDYFKRESITWSYEFLTEVLGIPVEKLAVSVFQGDDDCPRDDESAGIWKSCGLKDEQIFFLPKKNNWWGPAGITGPCGPDTEIFYISDKAPCSDECTPACDCGRYIEIWNNVFMQYFKDAQGHYAPMERKNVDTGMGLERTVCILSDLKSVYDTDLLKDGVELICRLGGVEYADERYTRSIRIIADHVRTAVFLLGDPRGITPSNVDQGYVLRRLIRRAVRFGRNVNLGAGALAQIATLYIDQYADVYPELATNREKIISELNLEEEKFSRTVQQGLKEFEKVVSHIPTTTLNGKTAFRLYDTFGFPIEMTVELAKEIGYDVDVEGYERAFKEHQEKSHSGAEQKFKGGLIDSGEATTRLHTATHIMLAAMRKVLSPDINQRGSNITAERLRFDFNFPRKLTDEELAAVEREVNDAISRNMDVVCKEMTVDEAHEEGATGIFNDRYGEKVKVYSIGDYSKEICGGPHVSNTSELGVFKILKEEASSSGVRRVKANLFPKE